VKIITPSGISICELSAHSRTLNAIACHPTRSVFATSSDDTFVHLFEVVGDKIEKIDVNLLVSSRVNDYMICGVAFGGENNSSLLAAPYDFKTIIVWNNIV
jgi:WD40 repeat protein